jgi:phage baseplate assembly protein W
MTPWRRADKMEFEVAAMLGNINFGATGVEEVLQNVRTILTTIKGTVPLDREFGLNTNMVDEPLPVTKTKLIAEIIMTVHKYEPRFLVTKVFFTDSISGTMDGILNPTVRGRIVSGV